MLGILNKREYGQLRRELSGFELADAGLRSLKLLYARAMTPVPTPPSAL